MFALQPVFVYHFVAINHVIDLKYLRTVCLLSQNCSVKKSLTWENEFIVPSGNIFQSLGFQFYLVQLV